MYYTKNEVLQFVEENDVKFIRLTFCDIFGEQKNISILPNQLERAFNEGISFDGSALKGFMNIEESDLFLIPDPTTLSILPWRPQQGRVIRLFCDIYHPDGRRFDGDARNLLKSAVKKIEGMGYNCQIGPECEFYLFLLDEKGTPTLTPHDNAGYFDIAPFDKGENVRREICLTLEDMDITPQTSHHEQGPGQNEIDFKHSDALDAADNLVTFRSVVKTIAARNGLYATFMPKPLENSSGNGLHINISLFKNGKNIFKRTDNRLSDEASHFIAGILNRIEEITFFLNPITNSYKRLGKFEAPVYVTWSPQNRSQLIRIPAAFDETARMELRSPDPICNPYIAFSLLIHAGIEGLVNKEPLKAQSDFNAYNATEEQLKGLRALPLNLFDAMNLAKESSFINSIIPKKTMEKILEAKLKEWNDYIEAPNKDLFEKNKYFGRI